MGSFVEGVDFDTIAREWRCKWSEDGDRKSLAQAQTALNDVLPVIKSIDGVKSVHRVVCGGNHDFKVSRFAPLATLSSHRDEIMDPCSSSLSQHITESHTKQHSR
jgi:hypothetical protein